MYHSSGPYYSSRVAGYSAGSGRSTDYTRRPDSSAPSAYSSRSSSYSSHPNSTNASLSRSGAPSASYNVSASSRGRDLTSAQESPRSSGYSGSGRTSDYSRPTESTRPAVLSSSYSSSYSSPSAATESSTRPSVTFSATGSERSGSTSTESPGASGYSRSGRTYDYTRPTDSSRSAINSSSYSAQPSTVSTGSTSTGRSSGYSGSGRTYASDYSRPTESTRPAVPSSSYSSRYSSPSAATESFIRPSVASVCGTGSERSGNTSAESPGASGYSRSGRTYDYTRPTDSSRSAINFSSYSAQPSATSSGSSSTGRTTGYSGTEGTSDSNRPTESSRLAARSSYTSSSPAQPSAVSVSSTRPSASSTTYSASGATGDTSPGHGVTRTSAYTLSGRPSDYSRPTESSRPTGYSSYSTDSSRPITSSRYSASSSGAHNVSSADGTARAEVERVRCGMLGDGVSGRANVISDKDFRDKNKVLMTSNQQQHASQLTTRDINLHKQENRRAHYTDKYEHSNLIVRRGESFDITLIFNRAYESSRDTIVLQFVVGYRPQESKGSIIRVPVSPTKDYAYGAWSVNIAQVNRENVRLQVTPPADAVVGRYQFYVETKTMVSGTDKQAEFRYQYPEEIIILFNPWCKDDTVYLDQETLREEYVLNDSGLIWMGTAKKHCGMPWNFGQFEDVSLNSCLWLLERAQLATGARANPLRVTRCISAMANFNDQDGGVLYGRWDSNYPKDTTPPTAWSGSVAILEQFWQKKNVVKFAQCWVFSGLVTTLLRAIGIPTRSVTNFASAHDSDASMTIDFHFDEDGKPLKELDDSVWNFHVWNESWFKRNDLPAGHDGWQAHDATPQETSYGVFRCGPASVKAVKQGEVYLPYDTNFVFAEVNGDRVFWEVEENGQMKVIRVDKKCIGKMISTKAAGSDKRDDITHEYKHPEGSIQERRAVEMAYKYSSRKDQAIYGLPTEDVKFSFELPDDVPIGKNVSVALKMKNTTYQRRTVKGKMTGMIGFYTGIPCKDLKEEVFEITVDPRQEKSFIMDFPGALYLDKCEADGGLKVYVKATVMENGQRFASYDTVDFQRPSLIMEITRGEVRVGRDFEVKLSFVNPLPVKITGGKWYIETSGINPKSKVIPNSANVPEGKQVQTSFKLTPYRAGLCRVSATFRADMLSGVRGTSGVQVME